jgi:hypothetical protein
MKAMYEGSRFDALSTLVVLIGYAIPVRARAAPDRLVRRRHVLRRPRCAA